MQQPHAPVPRQRELLGLVIQQRPAQRGASAGRRRHGNSAGCGDGGGREPRGLLFSRGSGARPVPGGVPGLRRLPGLLPAARPARPCAPPAAPRGGPSGEGGPPAPCSATPPFTSLPLPSPIPSPPHPSFTYHPHYSSSHHLPSSPLFLPLLTPPPLVIPPHPYYAPTIPYIPSMSPPPPLFFPPSPPPLSLIPSPLPFPLSSLVIPLPVIPQAPLFLSVALPSLLYSPLSPHPWLHTRTPTFLISPPFLGLLVLPSRSQRAHFCDREVLKTHLCSSFSSETPRLCTSNWCLCLESRVTQNGLGWKGP